MRRNTDLANKRQRHIEKLEESVKQLREVLSSLPEVERVILWGSYAQGRRGLLTDLDVFLVMRTKPSFLERQRFLYQRLALPEKFEPLKDDPCWRNTLKQVVMIYAKKTS